MSDRLTASGLQSSAGLFGQCGVYEFDLNGSIFNPQDLNPYLLFDAETSMIGTLENPTLDLDPSKQETLDVITATRAGVATFTDANGLVASAPANTVRVDHVDGVPMILVEPSATNLFTHSEGINNFSTLSRTNCTYSLDSNPFGGFNSSCKITSNTFTNSAIKAVLIFNSVSGESNYFTLRVKKKNGWFLKVVAGNATSSSNVDVGLGGEGFISAGGTTNNSYTVEEFNDYYLIGIETLQNATTIAGLISLIFYPDNSFSSYDLNTVEDFFVTGIQLENNATVATSYIPTSGGNAAARTRNADDLVISGSAFSSFYNGAEGTFYLEAIDRDPTSGTHSFLRGQSEHRDFLFKYNGTSIHSFDGSTGVSQSGISANQLFRAAVSFKSGSRTLSLNGTSPAAVSLNTNWTTADRLRIGNGNAVVANMHVKRVIFWPYHTDNL